MERADSLPKTGPDLSDLAKVMSARGPFLSVYLVTDGGVENAASRSERRWKTLCRTLEENGAPASVLDAIDPLVPDAHQSGSVLAVIANETGVLLAEHLHEDWEGDRGSWDRLPDLVPLVRWRQTQVPYVLALADRGGADLTAFQPGAAEIERSAGDDDPARKVKPGGWSQRRFQQRAENDWADTADDVAAQIAELTDRIDARLVILGGDVRAVNMIKDALPEQVADRTHLIDPGRASDGSEGARDDEVRRLVNTAIAEDTVALLQKFKEEKGQHDLAVEGAVATVDALNRAAVDILFVHDGSRERSAWVSDEPIPLGLGGGEEALSTGARGDEARLVDAMVRAALGTGATVRVVPEAGPVKEGIGGLLRWSETTG